MMRSEKKNDEKVGQESKMHVYSVLEGVKIVGCGKDGGQREVPIPGNHQDIVVGKCVCSNSI